MADYVVARVQAAGAAAANYDLLQQQQQQAHHRSLADHRPPPVSQRTTRGPRSLQQQQQQHMPVSAGDNGGRRQALEQEVAELRQQLSNEQTVHEILERALQHPNPTRSASVAAVGAFIPAKVKELLAELVLVEEEIARLESQIHEMKEGRRRLNLIIMQQDDQEEEDSCSGNNGHAAADADAAVAAAAAAAPPPPAPAPPPPRRAVPRPTTTTTAEIKSMFFISQAMDSDYYYLQSSKVRSPRDRDRRPASAASMSPKNSSSISAFAAAGGLPPRHSHDENSSNKQQQPKPATTPTTTTTTAMKAPQQQPNRLSERIVKCLVCIFIRLLRSSRVAELQQVDRSGPMSLQGMGMGSFRMDTALSSGGGVASANKLDSSKERGAGHAQQDPYGILAVPDAMVRDIGPYKNLVRFAPSSLDLMRGFSASPLLTKLRGMLEALQLVDLRRPALNHHQKLAFWLNVYNTCIMHGILQHGLPSNPDKLLALKNKATINVSGHKFNALVIENFILRQPSSVKEELWRCDVEVEEQAVREAYGLKTSEPNILFALCCGIRSSPALRIYKADRVVVQLEKAKLEYLQASLVVTTTTTTRRLMIPSLLHSSMHDFAAKDTEALLRWICEQLPTSWSLRKSMVDCLTSSMSTMKVAVDVIPFDYEFQYLLPMM